MEPVSAFITIVGLMSSFASGRDAKNAATMAEYIDWLRRNEHGQTAELILNNAKLSRAIEAMLSQQHEEVVRRLNEIDRVLAEVATHIVGFEGIASAMPIGSQLSEQAISILWQMNQLNASKIGDITSQGGRRFIAFDGEKGRINFTEERFC